MTSNFLHAVLGFTVTAASLAVSKTMEFFPWLLATTGQADISESVKTISNITLSGAAIYACAHLFKALLKLQERMMEAQKLYEAERLATALRHAEERRKDVESHTAALAKFYEDQKSSLKDDAVQAERSRNEMISRLEDIRDRLPDK